MIRAGGAALVGLTLVLGVPADAQADAPRARVLLVPPGPGDALAARLLDELFAAGIAVEIVPSPGGDAAALAARWGVDAVLRVDPASRGVTVWVVPLDPAEPPEQRVDPAPGRSDRIAEIALRSVEVLRGKLLRVERVRRDREASAPLPPRPVLPVPAVAPPRPVAVTAALPDTSAVPVAPVRRVALYVGPAITGSPGSGVGAGGATLTGVRFLSGHFGADAFALISVVPGVVEAEGGRVKLSTTAIGVGGWVEAFEPSAPLAIGGGVGVAGAFLGYEAQATSPAFVGRSGIVGYSLPFVRAALEWRAVRHFAVRLDALAGVAAPRPVVAVGPDLVAHFGRPLIALALGAQMTVP